MGKASNEAYRIASGTIKIQSQIRTLINRLDTSDLVTKTGMASSKQKLIELQEIADSLVKVAENEMNNITETEQDDSGE